MRAQLIVSASIALLLLAPTGQAAGLREELDDVRFEEFVFTFTWNTESDRANVNVDAKNLVLEGQAASELRHCIDGQDCAVPALSQAARDADRDGDVTEEEVDSFALYVKAGLASLKDMQKILTDIKGIVKIDKLAATSITFTDLRLDGAEGSVGSTDAIRLTVMIVGSFGTVPPADKHDVWIQRREANFTVAEEFVVQVSKGWRINDDTIKPASAQALFEKGKFSGTQDQFESSEPLEFTMEKSKSSPGWGLYGSLAALGVAAALTGLLVAQRRRKL